MMAWTKANSAAAVIGAVVIGCAGGIAVMKSATASAAPNPAPTQAPVPEEAADDATVSFAAAPPVVVKTDPQSGASNVDPATTEIKVTYSKDMRDGSWSWSTWGKDTFPKTTGKPHYLEDKRTCVLPVQLKPGHTYAVWLNSEKFGNFADSNGHKAVPYLLIFETKK